MTTYHYEQLRLTERHRVTCDLCGERINRQRTFTMTVNPFNRNEDGTVRTAREVWAALVEQGAAWQPDPLCARCVAP